MANRKTFGQATQQGRRADAVADLSGGDTETERAIVAIADGVGAANQVSTPPFLTPKLDALRWASR